MSNTDYRHLLLWRVISPQAGAELTCYLAVLPSSLWCVQVQLVVQRDRQNEVTTVSTGDLITVWCVRALNICLSTRQELNRLRKAALAFGFRELLKGVGDLLERECTLLPDSAHPDAAFQLSHAAKQLKLASTGDSQYSAFDQNIAPMHTDFSS